MHIIQQIPFQTSTRHRHRHKHSHTHVRMYAFTYKPLANQFVSIGSSLCVWSSKPFVNAYGPNFAGKFYSKNLSKQVQWRVKWKEFFLYKTNEGAKGNRHLTIGNIGLLMNKSQRHSKTYLIRKKTFHRKSKLYINAHMYSHFQTNIHTYSYMAWHRMCCNKQQSTAWFFLSFCFYFIYFFLLLSLSLSLYGILSFIYLFIYLKYSFWKRNCVFVFIFWVLLYCILLHVFFLFIHLIIDRLIRARTMNEFQILFHFIYFAV